MTGRPRSPVTPRDYNVNPFIVIWELTRACALKCLHCRAEAQYRRHPLELTFDEGRDLIDQIHEMDDPLLVFTGGDPLERDDVFDLAAHAVSRGIRVSMTPSATPNVTREAIRRAKDVGLSRWAFSLDGPTAEFHDHFRGTDGSFGLTTAAIDILREFELPLQINTTISRYNVDVLDEMAALVDELGCVLWSVFFLVPTGRGKIEDMISPHDHERVLRWLARLAERVPFDIKTTEAQHYRRVVIQEKMRRARGDDAIPADRIAYADALTKGDTSAFDGLGRAPKGVNDGNGFVFISHTGDVFPSGLLPVSGGNIRQTPLAKIYRDSPLFQALRNPDGYSGKCGVCDYRYICGGSRSRAYATTGDMLGSEEYCVYVPPAWRAKRAGLPTSA
jgi:radical SAM protein